MIDLDAPLDADTLARNRAHFGDEPHYFWVAFHPEEEPRLLDVNQVWQAAREGKKATHFQATCLLSTQRHLLQFLATLEGGAQ